MSDELQELFGILKATGHDTECLTLHTRYGVCNCGAGRVLELVAALESQVVAAQHEASAATPQDWVRELAAKWRQGEIDSPYGTDEYGTKIPMRDGNQCADDLEAHAAQASVAPPCADCDECARHAYSDATTPGFFYSKCEKHRQASVAPLVKEIDATIEKYGPSRKDDMLRKLAQASVAKEKS